MLVRSGVSGLQVTYAADEKMLFDVLVTIMRRCVQLFYEREPRAELLQLSFLLSFQFAFIVDFTPPTGVGVGFVLRNDLHLLTRSVLSDLTRTSWWATRCSCILGATSFSGPQHLEWICASSCHECQVQPGATESSPCCGTQYGSSGDAEVKIWGF